MAFIRQIYRGLRRFKNRVSDRIGFPLWLIFQRLRYGKKLIIISRLGALGDVVCTFPLCAEIQKKHPGKRFIFLTNTDYKKMVLLSRAADEVYGAKSWVWPFTLPAGYKLPGIVEAIYNPQTTDERVPNAGVQAHLIDDLAASCDMVITHANRQPHLYPSHELIMNSQAARGLTNDLIGDRLVIGINCGHTWPVRMWSAEKWQALVDKIHEEFKVVVLQFGFTKGDADEFEHLRAVRLLSNRLKSDELIALVARCRLIVSIDSGPIHIAGAVGVPVVGLFGAVNPRYRMPPDSPGKAVFAQVPCLFCHHLTPRGHWQTGCPNDIRCMKELDVQTVFEAVKSMLR